MPTEEGFVVMIFSESVPKESLVAFLQIEFRSVDGFRTIEVFEPAKWGAHFTDIVNWLSKFKKKAPGSQAIRFKQVRIGLLVRRRRTGIASVDEVLKVSSEKIP